MALFRKPRRQRPTAPSEPIAPSGPRASTPTEALREHLAEIAAAAAVPEDALEPALTAVLEASRAQAGALCVFDPRHQILRLVSEVGLSDEGCRRLRSVRRADPTAWDMPLHGLLNRRAYLIESAARNRYVPRLVEQQATVRTVACMPLYAGPIPVGSLVLIALAPRSLSERDIHSLERAVGELAAIIEAVRRRAGVEEERAAPPPRRQPVGDHAALRAECERLRAEVTARLAERAVLAAEVTSRSGEADRLRAALEAANAERARVAAELERAWREAERTETLTASLEAAERERARLVAALEAAAAERAGRARADVALEQARADAERAAAAAASELEAARRLALAGEAEIAARTAGLTAEIERLQARLEQVEGVIVRERALAREREDERTRMAHELRAAAEREQRLRDDLHAASGRAATAGHEAVEHALETARRAEEERATVATELQAVRNALASAQEVVLALEEEAARANAEIERLVSTGRATGTEHERLEIALAEGRSRELAAGARIEELVREADGFRQESVRLAAEAREREAEGATLAARLEGLAAERDRLREALAAAEVERDRAVSDAAATAARQAQLTESLARETSERERLTAALGTAQSALGELVATLSRREAEMAEQAVGLERLRPVEEAERREAREAAASVREPMRVVTVVPPASGRRREGEAGRRVIGVLDLEQAWAGLTVDGHHVAVIAPSDDIADQLTALSPARVVVNLMAPGALEAVAALRAGGSTARFWGCVADAMTDRALGLGMIEPAARPIDPDAIVEILGRYAVRGTRVVTAGADVDALMSLRQALARRGLSVSMAWDAKQAGDLLHVVRPEVVVVDLGLPRRDGFGIVARFAAADPAPSAVLIPGDDDMPSAFAATLADPAHAGRILTLGQLLGAVLGRSEAPPVEKRHHPRVRAAVGRK